MEWEYKIQMVHIYGVASDTIARRLSELGTHGWEAVSTINKSGDTAGVLMKRLKTKSTSEAVSNTVRMQRAAA
jgi:predicted transcriptional regulator